MSLPSYTNPQGKRGKKCKEEVNNDNVDFFPFHSLKTLIIIIMKCFLKSNKENLQLTYLL